MSMGDIRFLEILLSPAATAAQRPPWAAALESSPDAAATVRAGICQWLTISAPAASMAQKGDRSSRMRGILSRSGISTPLFPDGQNRAPFRWSPVPQAPARFPPVHGGSRTAAR